MWLPTRKCYHQDFESMPRGKSVYYQQQWLWKRVEDGILRYLLNVRTCRVLNYSPVMFLLLSADGVHRKVLSSGLESQKPPEWRTFLISLISSLLVAALSAGGQKSDNVVVDWYPEKKEAKIEGCLRKCAAWIQCLARRRERQFLPVLTLLYLPAPFAKFKPANVLSFPFFVSL